jgi:hypothetical protein
VAADGFAGSSAAPAFIVATTAGAKNFRRPLRVMRRRYPMHPKKRATFAGRPGSKSLLFTDQNLKRTPA